MPDKDKQVTDKPIEETKVEESTSSPTAPTNDAVTPAGADQLGRQLYNVKCAKCGKQTQVPFKPSGDRPVYCRDCYMQKKGEGPRR